MSIVPIISIILQFIKRIGILLDVYKYLLRQELKDLGRTCINNALMYHLFGVKE